MNQAYIKVVAVVFPDQPVAQFTVCYRSAAGLVMGQREATARLADRLVLRVNPAGIAECHQDTLMGNLTAALFPDAKPIKTKARETKGEKGESSPVPAKFTPSELDVIDGLQGMGKERSVAEAAVLAARLTTEEILLKALQSLDPLAK